jgi:RNA polymerase sigma-70 factor (ECF subfamily)
MPLQAPPAQMPTAAQQDQFLALLERHGGIIRKVAAAYSRTAADRHDLMQEIRLQLWRAYPRYSPARPFSTWMYRVALNVAISFLRGPGNPSRQFLALEQGGADFIDASTSATDSDERVAALRRVIELFDPLNRALLLLYLDERSYREIAEILGLSETNVATKLARLKERIRRELTEVQGE